MSTQWRINSPKLLLWLCVLFYSAFVYTCACVFLHIQNPLRECRSIRSGASGLPFYCAPLVFISVVIRFLTVWRLNKSKTKNQEPDLHPFFLYVSRNTEIPSLVPRWKYHLSNWPLSFFFSTVFYYRCCHVHLPPLPPFGVYMITFSPWSRVLSFSFRVYHSILISGTVCTVLMNLWTNPWCGPFHINRQGISRFAQYASVFLIFKYFVPPNVVSPQ